MFFVGAMLYVLIITLIFYCFMFLELRPADLSHSYWINMGAVAISTLAGTVLIANAPGNSFLSPLISFISGLTIFFWAVATWWIPFLVALGVWRFVIHREKMSYDPLYWSMVFPIGMYTTCTFRLGEATKLGFLFPISRCFIFAAITAWTLTFFGLLHSIAAACRRSPDTKLR